MVRGLLRTPVVPRGDSEIICGGGGASGLPGRFDTVCFYCLLAKYLRLKRLDA